MISAALAVASARAWSISARMRWMARSKPDEDRLADQEVADVQLDDRRNGGDRRHGIEVDAVAGMDLQARGARHAARRPAGSSSRSWARAAVATASQ